VADLSPLPPNARDGHSWLPHRRMYPCRSGIGKDRRARLLARDGNRCVWCGGTENLQLDHIIPLHKEGSDEDANYQVLCRGCNMKKGKR
jgi:5-methylcytosine-specific restriction endonuclease McrA